MLQNKIERKAKKDLIKKTKLEDRMKKKRTMLHCYWWKLLTRLFA